MKKSKGLVLDANILVRAVLGKRVRKVLDRYQEQAQFFSPVAWFEEARKHLPVILKNGPSILRQLCSSSTTCQRGFTPSKPGPISARERRLAAESDRAMRMTGQFWRWRFR